MKSLNMMMWRRAKNVKRRVNLARIDLTHVPKILGIIAQWSKVLRALKLEKFKGLKIGHDKIQ